MHVSLLQRIARGATLALGLTLAHAALAADAPQVSIKTSAGEIVLELEPEKAPKNVANFLQYVKSGHYKGLIFHRVINDFMIQAGGVDKDLKPRRTGKPVVNESNNGLQNLRYTVAMARTGNPNSATDQFFINVADNPNLDYPGMDGSGYTVFGRVIAGHDVIDKIKGVVVDDLRGYQNVPVIPIIIKSTTLLKNPIVPKE